MNRVGQRVLASMVAVLTVACRGGLKSTSSATANEVVVSIRSEPQSFNAYRHRDAPTRLVSLLTQAKLVRVNQASQDIEPWLAESWTRSSDGRRFRLALHKDVQFSDGHPFTADDVVFSFAAAYDGDGSTLADSLEVGGKRLLVTAVDPLTVDITFPTAFGPGLRLLDNLPILPRHRLEAAVNGKSFASAWAVTTPPSQIVGLGAFVLSEYVSGQRLVFVRNPHYFRKDASGRSLPYLDRVVCRVIPEQQTELMQLGAGAIDFTLTEPPLASYAVLKQDADAGRIQLLDLGPAYDAESLWFNLRPGAFANDPRASWLQRDELRQAISLAVDRQRFVDTVYFGAAIPVDGPITPANKKWFVLRPNATASDPARARTLLAAIGLTDANGDGMLDDRSGHPARFTLLTQKGQVELERGAAVIRDELKKIGLTVDVVPLDQGTVIKTFLSGRGYDAVYFHVAGSDTDPAINPDFWLSSGSAHFWNLRETDPPSPPAAATDWERHIDEVMLRQMTSTDDVERRRLFAEVQSVFAEHLPVVYFAAPKLLAAASRRVTNLTPAVMRPQLLWSIDTIAVKP